MAKGPPGTRRSLSVPGVTPRQLSCVFTGVPPSTAGYHETLAGRGSAVRVAGVTADGTQKDLQRRHRMQPWPWVSGVWFTKPRLSGTVTDTLQLQHICVLAFCK